MPGLKRLVKYGFTPVTTTSIGTVELRFQKRRCLRSDNIAADYVTQRTAEGKGTSSNNVSNALDREPPIMRKFHNAFIFVYAGPSRLIVILELIKAESM